MVRIFRHTAEKPSAGAQRKKALPLSDNRVNACASPILQDQRMNVAHNDGAQGEPAQLQSAVGTVQLGKKKGAGKGRGKNQLKKGGSKQQRQRYVGKLGTDKDFQKWFHQVKGKSGKGGADSADSAEVRDLYQEYLNEKRLGRKGGDAEESDSDTDTDESEAGEDPIEEMHQLQEELDGFNGPRNGKKWEKFSGDRLERLSELREETGFEGTVDVGPTVLPTSKNPYDLLQEENQ
jgi:hypothetical protein